MRAPWAVAVLVFVVGFAWVWAFGGFNGESAWCDATVPETASYSVERALWPPGAGRCVIDGRTQSTHVPWFEWLVVAFVAATAGLAAAGFARAVRDDRGRV
jgi:hypothetical protein